MRLLAHGARPARPARQVRHEPVGEARILFRGGEHRLATPACIVLHSFAGVEDAQQHAIHNQHDLD
jgi:hypothetical protein